MKNHSIIDNQANKISGAQKKMCPVNATIDILSGKWKMRILWELRKGIKRFGELKDAIEDITPAMLSAQLHVLTREGVVHRVMYAEIPPKVEYSLTEIGKSLISLIGAMETWGVEFVSQAKSSYNTECLWNDPVN